MAPTLLGFYVVFLSFLFVHCLNVVCPTGEKCRKNVCYSPCTCLGSFVDCSKKKLNAIPIELPTWVEMLDLQDNAISFIDESALKGLKYLTELNLSNNQLRHINSSTFKLVSSLQKLNIDSNHLTEMPDLANHQSLTSLNIQHNEINSLDVYVLEKFSNLRNLDLSFNNLVELSSHTFGHSSSLLHLSLSHNRIGQLETGAFDNLTALESLKLSKNELVTIPKELFRHLINLRHLEINSNPLIQIEGLSFQGLISLVVLKLRHSHISNLLDGAFYGLNSIKKLQLDYNQIDKITKGWLYGLHSLQQLFLGHNNITMIEDDAWDSVKRLLELDLSDNKLEYLTSKTFNKLYSLKRLTLSNNRITYMEEGCFNSLSALQYLELQNNQISSTIEDSNKIFNGLARLRFLGLANNNVKSVTKRVFTGLTRLETLNLTLNPITTIEKNTFVDLPQLHTLLMNTSSLLCDCHLSWMSKDFHYPAAIAKCAYPEEMKGISVSNVSLEVFVCEGLPKPIIVKEPATKITLKGENVTLDCEAKSDSDSTEIKFEWRKDGKLLHNMRLWSKSSSTKLGNLMLHKSSLFIEKIEDNDEGLYQCVISNRFGAVYSSKAHITVNVYPVFTKTPVDIAMKSGSTARLECGATGQPQPDIAWKKDGGEDFPAARERRMHVMPTDDIFFITSLKSSDAGVYSCTAKNLAGLITANVTLTVLETPTFVKKMENKEVRVGDTAVLECRASGNPKPKLTWAKDGAPLIANDRHFFSVGNQLLVIDSAKYSDSGIYTCEMSNALGIERGTSHLKVLPANAGDEINMMGYIVIAVVLCVVGTSIGWVIVIYHMRKPRRKDLASIGQAGETP